MKLKIGILFLSLWCFLGGVYVIFRTADLLDLVAASFLIFAPFYAAFLLTFEEQRVRKSKTSFFENTLGKTIVALLYALVGAKLLLTFAYPAFFQSPFRNYYYAAFNSRSVLMLFSGVLILSCVNLLVSLPRTTLR